ncbi:MAG TPA: iron-containing alcohol dehydrogenase [Pirellulaceae bacterium]
MTGLLASPFEFRCAPRIVAGCGSLARVGDLTAGLGVERVLLVTDPGLVAAGHAARCEQYLAAAQLTCARFDGVRENPSTTDVDLGLAVARDFRPEVLLALGGGSAMDCTKGINFLYTNGGRMEDYWGTGKAHREMLPALAIPTTAGTGSEVQSFALISRTSDGTKMACGDPRVAFRFAILDPELLTTCPKDTAALAGLDALAHAIETFVSTRRNDFSAMLSRQAFQWLAHHLDALVGPSVSLETWSFLQRGACLAGLAIENSMLGAAHALSNPLTARCHVPHGQAVAMMLPHVIEFNRSRCDALYAELASLAPAPYRVSGGGIGLVSLTRELLQTLRRPASLREVSVAPELLPELARSAAEQWTGTFNPVPFGAQDALDLYERAY